MNTVVKHTDPLLKRAAIILVETLYQVVQTDVYSAENIRFNYTLSKSGEFELLEMTAEYPIPMWETDSCMTFSKDSEEVISLTNRFKKWIEKNTDNKEFIKTLFSTTPESIIGFCNIERYRGGYQIFTSLNHGRYVDLDYNKDYITIDTYVNSDKNI